MRLLTISNLYPRPDQPQRGLFNAQQFRAMAEALGGRRPESGNRRQEKGSQPPASSDRPLSPGGARPIVDRQPSVINLCLVPEWRVWRWGAIRQWQDPYETRLGTRYLPVFYVPLIGRSLSWSTYRFSLEGLRAEFDSADVVLATWLYPDAVAAAQVASAARKPIWIKVHGTDRLHLRSPSRRRRILAACRVAQGVISNCRFIADWLADAGVDRSKLHIVPNGVDAERFLFRPRDMALESLRARCPAAASMLAAESQIVLYVANLSPIKGPDIMLETWRRFREQRPEAGGQSEASACLVMIGDGLLRGRMQALARHLGVANSVVFLGRRPHDEIALWMNSADCLCLTSRSEGMPNVVLEALSSGLPVVATDVGACGELLADEFAARVVRIEENLPARIAGALEEVLDLSVDRRLMAQRHAGRFAWPRSAGQILELMGGQEQEGSYGV